MGLQTHEVRFAHDSQSEFFAHGVRRSLLQLAVELVTGQTSSEDVPLFDVCKHEGFWYCRSGNRRLAAFRLAQRFLPSDFGRIQVRSVATDTIFLWGGPNKRPKLTTGNNGADC